METLNYKLIKCYPDSPELGYIIKPKDGDNYYWNHAWFNPADFPEFWEKVVKVPKYIKLLDSEYIDKIGAYRIAGIVYEVNRWSGNGVWVRCNIAIREYNAGYSFCMDTLYNHPEYYVEATKEEYEEQLVPKYVLCTKDETSTYKKGKIYKVDVSERIYYDKLTDDYWGLWGCNQSRFIPSTKEEYDAQFTPDYVGTYFTTKGGFKIYSIKEGVDSKNIISWETGSTNYLKNTINEYFKNGSWIKATKDDYDRCWKLGEYSKEVFINCIAYVNKPITYTLEEIGEVIEKKIGWGVLWNNKIKPELIEFKK